MKISLRNLRFYVSYLNYIHDVRDMFRFGADLRFPIRIYVLLIERKFDKKEKDLIKRIRRQV